MLHSLTPEPGCTVLSTVQLEEGLGFKRKYASYLLITASSSRLTTDGVSLVLKRQSRMTAWARQTISEIVVATMGEVKRLLTPLFY